MLITEQPYTGAGPPILGTAPEPPPRQAAVPLVTAPPAANATAIGPESAPAAKQTILLLPAPVARPPPHPAPTPSRPVSALQMGDNQRSGSFVVMDCRVRPAKPDADINRPPQILA